jgi:hypothetical protein
MEKCSIFSFGENITGKARLVISDRDKALAGALDGW